MIEITENRINLVIDGNIIGYIIYSETPHFIVGSYIYVTPNERGKGHTKSLMEAFIKFVTEKNKKVKATCPVINRFLSETNPGLLVNE